MPASEPDKAPRESAGNAQDAAEQKKLVPPPPIIGPDGKEIPRPKDAAGRPLPVYVTSEGKAILDDDGRPIPIRFGEDGKPIPLDVLKGERSKRQDQGASLETVVVARKGSALKVPSWVKWMGAIDIVIGIAVGLYYVYETSEAHKKKELTWHLFITTVLIFVGALNGGMLMIAERKNKTNLVWMWACVILLLTVIQTGVCITVGLQNSVVGALAYYIVRLIVALCTGCIISTDADYSSTGNSRSRDNRLYTTVPGSRGYPSRGVKTVGAPQTIILQQPAYYGGYGGYRDPYYYGGAADAALLDFAAGSMMGGGYGMGWGGGFGYDYYDDGFGYDGFGW